MLLNRKLLIIVIFYSSKFVADFPAASVITVVSTTPTLNSNFSASTSQTVTFSTSGSILLDGGNNTLAFSRTYSPQMILQTGVNLTVQNIVLADYAGAKVTLGSGASLTFGQNTNLIFNQDLTMSTTDLTWTFSGGTSTIAGDKCQLTVNTSGQLSVLGGTSLVLKNLDLYTTVATPFTMQNNSSTVTFQNSRLLLGSNGFTFSTGNLNFLGDNRIMGQNSTVVTSNTSFTFTSAGQMVIGTQSWLTMDKGITFVYQANPVNDATLYASKRHLVFTDYSSCLFLNGAALTSTTTALALGTGHVLIGDRVVATSSTGAGQQLELGSNLKLEILAGAVLELQGPTNYILGQ